MTTALRLGEPSPAERLAKLDEDERAALLRGMGERQVERMMRDWRFWARPDQLEPEGDWRNWLVQAGRGAGKTRTGAEWVCDRAKAFALADADHLIGLGNRTFGEVRALQIEGVSGLKAVCARRGYEFHHAATSRNAELVVPRAHGFKHQSKVELHTSREPDLARGRNFNTFWHDEFASYYAVQDEQGGTMFTNVDLGLRALGPVPPRSILTFTPRNVPWLRDLLDGKFGPFVLTRATLFDNLSNLHPSFVRVIMDRYAHSPLGAQEIYGELVETVEGALWTPAKIGVTRLAPDALPYLYRVAIGVDPSGGRAEAGIVGAGVGKGADGKAHLYLLDDSSSVGDADVWPGEVVAVYHRLRAEIVAAERNFGGDMVRVVIKNQDADVRVHLVQASRGKQLRAEPVANLWAPNQRRGHIVGHLPLLENEMCTWRPGDDSPNRLDSAVFAAAELMPDLALAVETAAYGSVIAGMRM